MIDLETKKQTLTRLKRIGGSVQGIRRMVDQRKGCHHGEQIAVFYDVVRCHCGGGRTGGGDSGL